VAGGICGLVLGAWATGSIAALNIDALPRGHEVAMDVTTVLVVLALTSVVGLLLGVAPALRLWRMNLNAELREETRGGTSGRRGSRLRRALATVQVAVALVLLVGAGLLLSSFRAVLNLDFGFAPAGVSTASVNLPSATYGNADARAQFATRALDAIRAIPGVEAAGTTTMIPFSNNTSNSVILAEGRAQQPGESLLAPANAVVSDGYFDAMSIDVVTGRGFNAGDTSESTRVVVIDQRLADRFWPGREAVGRRLYEPDDPSDLTRITDNTTFYLVVGVVETIQASDPRADIAPVGTYYFPAAQRPRASFALAVKSTSRDAAVMGDVRRALTAIDPELPLYSVRTMQEWIDRALVTRRVPMVIAIVFSAIAAFLAAVGIYGVLAFGVAQRERELGVRMALGGSSASVFKVVLGEGVRIVALGLTVGLAGAYGVGQIMRGQLFGVAPMDLLVLSTVVGVLVVASLVASSLPAWRASRINPIVVLGR
jgi:predicted permease